MSSSTPRPAPLPPFACKRQGILFVVSAPSGAGKSTLLHQLRPFADFEYSVSCTTRQPRSGEVHGIDYHFLSRSEFEQEIQSGNLLEWAEVHGNYYGTRTHLVSSRLREGVDLIVDVDVQGARSIRNSTDPVIQSALVDVFLAPPSMEILQTRLRSRGTESEDQVELRLRNASSEMNHWRDYRYLIISGSPEDDMLRFRAIMNAERLRAHRLVEPSTPSA
jgi:guanylate kinase